MARPTKYSDPATEVLRIRVTPAQRRDLEQVAEDNDTDLSGAIREAVDEYVSDYRESTPFRRTKP